MKNATAFADNLLILGVIAACSLVAVASYFRFFIDRDYIVSYEGTCDPQTTTCFSGCKDDNCIETYEYSKVQKYGADLYAECGDDITNCQSANICLPTDRKCSITYCDTKADGVACAQVKAGVNGFNSAFSLNTK
jgi:hypothetical protein